MIAFYEKHSDKKDKFEVFAFHDPAAKTLADLEAKLPKIKEKHWGGKDLPFPTLLDATGETVKTWGISGFPTQVLIDPQGRVVRTNDAKKALEEALARG